MLSYGIRMYIKYHHIVRSCVYFALLLEASLYKIATYSVPVFVITYLAVYVKT
jgi:hypothetical protein